MTEYWCVNFEDENSLRHGIQSSFWSMGYQYSKDQSDSANRKGVIRKNWERLQEIDAGHKFVAYLPGNRFFAAGTVRTPRREKTKHDLSDTIEEYLKRGIPYRKGYVYFPPVVYENFTDKSGHPVRVDVERWENYVPDGVVARILKKVLPNELQKAAFKINKRDFDRIVKKLIAGNGLPSKQDESEFDEETEESMIDALEVGQAKSQGFQVDSKLRKEIENYAMNAATQYFVSEGFEVESKGKPFDLLCRKGKEKLYVEVKGTQTTGEKVILTTGEVRFARQNKSQMGLFVLHSIKVSRNTKELSEGQKRVAVPWDVDQGSLSPLSYMYQIGASRH